MKYYLTGSYFRWGFAFAHFSGLVVRHFFRFSRTWAWGTSRRRTDCLVCFAMQSYHTVGIVPNISLTISTHSHQIVC